MTLQELFILISDELSNILSHKETVRVNFEINISNGTIAEGYIVEKKKKLKKL